MKRQPPSNLADDRDFDVTPNIALNFNPPARRYELLWIAVIGVVFQIGVIILQTITSRYPKIKANFATTTPISKTSFELSISGTLSLLLAMFCCSLVVETGAERQAWHSPDQKPFHLMWIQTEKVVNDQKFGSCALFSRGERTELITSHPSRPSAQSEQVATCATFLGIIGFIVQFIGLRGLHWSATWPQLGTTLIMTILRSWIRRDIANKPHSVHLPVKFETDWLTTRIYKLDSDSEKSDSSSPRVNIKAQSKSPSNLWEAVEFESSRGRGGSANATELQSEEFWNLGCKCFGVSAHRECFDGQRKLEPIGENVTGFQPNDIIRLRARFATMRNEALSEIALALSSAIELSLNTGYFFHNISSENRKHFEANIHRWAVCLLENSTETEAPLHLKLNEDTREWHTVPIDLYAILSLWQYTKLGISRYRRSESLFFLTPYKAQTLRDLQWWCPQTIDVVRADLPTRGDFKYRRSGNASMQRRWKLGIGVEKDEFYGFAGCLSTPNCIRRLESTNAV